MKIAILATNNNGNQIAHQLIQKHNTDNTSLQILIINQTAIDQIDNNKIQFNKIKQSIKDNNTTLNLTNDDILTINNQDNHYIINTKHNNYPVNKVIVDHNLISLLNSSQQSINKYGNDNSLNQINPLFVSDQQLSNIKPNQEVLIQGLNNRFFYFLMQLTEKRGGKFRSTNKGKLKYIPSGNEPKIIAGSKRGVPFYPKANHPIKDSPKFLNQNKINNLTNQNKKLNYKQLTQLIKNEIELVYYTKLFQKKYPKQDIKKFREAFISADNPKQVINKYDLKQNEELNWQLILNPVAGLKITTIKDYQKTLSEWMNTIIKDNNQNGPITTSLSMINQLVQPIQEILKNNLINKESYQNKFKSLFRITTDFLANGPTNQSMKKLLALMNAGIITILGPQMKTIGAMQQFMSISVFYSKEIFKAKNLINTKFFINNMNNVNPINNLYITSNNNNNTINKI